jgi:hypothetical protein
LTGNNHYPCCTCGWCVGGGNHGRVAPSAPRKPATPTYAEQEKRQAKQALTNYGASSYSRCFVNPNAFCPVCGQTVYFYANSYGSRVYFDELGKPWIKHPCTDNGRPTSTVVDARPTRRPLTEIIEILDAEKKIDRRILPVGRNTRGKSWELAVVIEAEFAGFVMMVLIEDLSTPSQQQHSFHVYCDQPLLNAGDFVSQRSGRFSFLHPISLESIEVVDGELLLDLDALEGDIDHNEIPRDIHDMVPSEKRHFYFGHWPNINVHDELRLVLEKLVKRRIVGPKLVSHYLNEAGRTTANGSPWTPRLAFFLISLSGVSQVRPLRLQNSRSSHDLGTRLPKRESKTTKGKNRPKSGKAQVAVRSSKKQAIDTQQSIVRRPSTMPTKLSNDVDDWARKLARLGRVSRKGHDE